jgi:ABC-type sugar transport system ATPase subunit
MTAIRLEQVTKRYNATVALDAVDLSIHDGELFFLLGPSGCGNSTLLRLIAGLQSPTQGRILFDGRTSGSSGPVEAAMASDPEPQSGTYACIKL